MSINMGSNFNSKTTSNMAFMVIGGNKILSPGLSERFFRIKYNAVLAKGKATQQLRLLSAANSFSNSVILFELFKFIKRLFVSQIRSASTVLGYLPRTVLFNLGHFAHVDSLIFTVS